jgi:hypothetical protein
LKNRANLPDFFVVGAMKAGTTTLMDYLNQHPDVYLPDYEVHFFDRECNYKKGLEWYTTHFLKSNNDIIGEKTPTYSYDPKVPARIYSNFPDAKIVWILRNPTARTYSNYLHAVKVGKENLPFDSAVALEEKRIGNNAFKGYIERSIYIKQINNYLDYFPMKSMHFIIFEEFIKDPDGTLAELYKFLEINHINNNQILTNSLKLNKKNVSSFPRSITLQYYSQQLFGTKSFIYKVVNYLNNIFPKTPPKIQPNISNELDLYFRPFNNSLAHLINKDLSCWNKYT